MLRRLGRHYFLMNMTETELTNIALSHLGEARIMDLNERSPVAEHCRRVFGHTRDKLLRRCDWNFAQHRAILAKLSGAPLFGWTAAFQLPSDYIKLVEFNGYPAGTSQSILDIEGDKLLCNEEAAEIVYTRVIDQTSMWDSSFCDAFTLFLAAAVAPSITSTPAMALNMAEMAERLLYAAVGENMSEDRPRAILAYQDSAWIKARRGGQ